MTLSRIQNDYRTYYETLAELIRAKQTVYLIDTDMDNPDAWIFRLSGLLDELEGQ